MKKYLVLLFIPLLVSCDSEQERRQLEQFRIREELKKKPNQSLSGLEKTAWTSEVLSDCHDTLMFLDAENAALYSCELGYQDNCKYKVAGDTIVIDLISGKSGSEKEDQVPSRWKMVMKDSTLLFTYIAHKYEDDYLEVDGDIYNTITTFQKVR